jgi:hypothetical protein
LTSGIFTDRVLEEKERNMTEFTVHFQKGFRVGARSLRMVTVEAADAKAAMKAAKAQFHGEQARGYRLTRVDHYDEETGRMAVDY